MRLKDKVALITGGAGEIARSLTKTFLANGAKVILTDLNEAALKEIVQEMNAGSDLATVGGNVCKLEDMLQVVKFAEDIFGKIDILVTCAGITRHAPIDEMSLEDWNAVMNINITGTFLACKAVVSGMKERKYGRIVTISSVGGRTGRPTVGVNYAASKAGVVGFTQTLARELGSFGITVNAVSPGPLKTKMFETISPEKAAMLTSAICLGRLGTTEDVANSVIFLASDEAAWITGEVLDVNGGVYM